MNSKKRKLSLNKHTIDNLNRIDLNAVIAGTGDSDTCDVSRNTMCVCYDCESHFFCFEPKTADCPLTTN